MTALIVRLYYRSRVGQARFVNLVQALFAGFWLGVAGRRTLDAIDDEFYVGRLGSGGRSRIDYSGEVYNAQGLFAWEREAVLAHFPSEGHLGLLAAGGGREVLALSRMGYRVDAWECQTALIATANDLLVAAGFTPSVRYLPRDVAPEVTTTYDGLIIGWSTYTLVAGADRRIALLRGLRDLVEPGAPLLVSFYARKDGDARFRVATRLANVLRRLRGRQPVEPGDYLDPNFVHLFTEAEIRKEFEAAGFELRFFTERPYAHAVAVACGPVNRPNAAA